ncbi:maltose/moltooligosaccharide transporter [Blastomonas natatoria]|uniref:Maltose/moltooligosaccharide transporter n=1 Tax=Blastomonas natatoria TaxID=34015 RepID=A0A2V3V4K9_9SPHN|nr:MFS transporter [Blastomonas natatoria]PXW76420.1 maltose/moltooligosaccharide transporter [Blastomonas natatoria]
MTSATHAPAPEFATPRATPPRLSLARIVEMNLGFFGLQFSFGLQQANMTPIYTFLGADEATMPLLWLAGPMTGLLIQPIVGALSDRTRSKLGRRTPYFLIGAVICSLCLFLMPYSSTLWMAASLLWLLDAGNNITMEPYRAYVADRLEPEQRPAGFLVQSAFTGLAQCLSYAAPSLLVGFGISQNLVDLNGIPVIVRIAFVIGAILSISTIVWSVVRVPELKLNDAELAEMAARPMGAAAALAEIRDAFIAMPRPMRQLAWAMLCQWYAMFVYWQYIALSVSRTLFPAGESARASSADFISASLTAQQMGVAYNAVSFVAALALIPIVRRLGAKPVHALCLVASGIAMLSLPMLDSRAAMFVPMIGIGLGWAGMMGNTYVMLADCIPPERTGVYMGIFNMFIVIPMLIETMTMPLIYGPLLGSDPRNAILLAGVLMLCGAVATLMVGRAQRIGA